MGVVEYEISFFCNRSRSIKQLEAAACGPWPMIYVSSRSTAFMKNRSGNSSRDTRVRYGRRFLKKWKSVNRFPNRAILWLMSQNRTPNYPIGTSLPDRRYGADKAALLPPLGGTKQQVMELEQAAMQTPTKRPDTYTYSLCCKIWTAIPINTMH